MQTASSDISPPLAQPGAVCRRCLYGLKGLPSTANCTECGEPVNRGLDPDWWGNRPRATLERVKRGALGAFWATTAAGVLGYASIAVYYGPGTQLLALAPVRIALTSTHALLAAAVGVFMLLALRASADLWPARSRLCAVVAWGAALLAALLVMQYASSALYTRGPLSQTFIVLWGITPPASHVMAMAYAVVFLRLGRLMNSRAIVMLSVAKIAFAVIALLFTVPTCFEMLAMLFPRSGISISSTIITTAYRAQSLIYYFALPIVPLQFWLVTLLTRRLLAAKSLGL